MGPFIIILITQLSCQSIIQICDLEVCSKTNIITRISPAPPPPTPGSEGRVPKISGKGVLFVPENCKKKKKGVFDFSPGDFFKKGGGFSFSLSLDA